MPPHPKMADRFTVPDPVNGGTLTVQLLREVVKLRGVPPQGADFFRVYYALFRGRGVLLSASKGGRYGLFASINKFFTATSVLYLGCEAGSMTGSHIEAAVLSPTVLAMEAVCMDPERRNMSAWAGALTRSLVTMNPSQPTAFPVKDAARFRIEMPPLSSHSEGEPRRDRDLVVHYVDDLFPPAPTPEAARSLATFLNAVQEAAHRLMLGGFYVLALPMSYNGIDLLLSSILALDTHLTYVGMLMYLNSASQMTADDAQLPLWIFRIEPINVASLESQRAIAQNRLTRYPPSLQDVVKSSAPASSEIRDLGQSSFEAILSARVTPTASINSLFRQVAGPNPKEVINMLGSFQSHYSTTIDQARQISNLKIQVKIIVELLYDLALASQRRCAVKTVA